MFKKILLAIILLLSILFLVYALSYKEEPKQEDKDITQDDCSNTITEGNFTLVYTCEDDNLWKYTVSGQLPNPCYEVSTEVLVAESYPEQVTVVVAVTEPDADTMCAQVIQEYEYSGEFNASRGATVTLQVK